MAKLDSAPADAAPKLSDYLPVIRVPTGVKSIIDSPKVTYFKRAWTSHAGKRAARSA